MSRATAQTGHPRARGFDEDAEGAGAGAIAGELEGGDAVRAGRSGQVRGHATLNVVWMEIPPTDNDEVLHTARDVEFAVVEKAEVARAHRARLRERGGGRSLVPGGAGCGLVLVPPVTACHGGGVDPLVPAAGPRSTRASPS